MPGVSHGGRPQQRARGLVGGRRDTPKPDDAAARPRAAGGRIDAATGAASWAPACCSSTTSSWPAASTFSAPTPTCSEICVPDRAESDGGDGRAGGCNVTTLGLVLVPVHQPSADTCVSAQHSSSFAQAEHLRGRGTRRLGWAANKCPKGQSNLFVTCRKTSAGSADTGLAA